MCHWRELLVQTHISSCAGDSSLAGTLFGRGQAHLVTNYTHLFLTFSRDCDHNGQLVDDSMEGKHCWHAQGRCSIRMRLETHMTVPPEACGLGRVGGAVLPHLSRGTVVIGRAVVGSPGPG